MLPTVPIACPYCGEHITLAIDASAGDQRYIEDCQVCCQPIDVAVRVADDGEVDVDVRAQDDA